MRRAWKLRRLGRGVGLYSGVGAGEEEGVLCGVIPEVAGRRARNALCFSSREILLL
jgi:hypothetical protein